jgi:HrpA-like RNA helicase
VCTLDDSKCDQARNLNESDSQPQSEKDGLGKELPIDAHKTHIIDTIQNNRVTIIQGETGSGKSSRVPVFCLEEENAKVVICQPRRIAAKSLADRIRATEPHLKDQVALRMGHGVRENENKNTRAWFMTTVS